MILLSIGLLMAGFLARDLLQPEPFLSSPWSYITAEKRDPPTALLFYSDPLNPFEESPPDWEGNQRIIQTSLQLITSPATLSRVVVNRDIWSLGCMKNTEDPEEFLRQHIKARQSSNSAYLIEVSAPALPPDESVIILNAIVESFLEIQERLEVARAKAVLRPLEEINTRLEAEIRELLVQPTVLERIPLEPEGPTLSRSEVEAEYLDCLAALRRVRLDRAALPPDAGEDARAPLDRQEAVLLDERDRLANAIARADASEAKRLLRQNDIDHLLERRIQIQKHIMRERHRTETANSRFVIIHHAR